jgi:hypothetical protein
MFDFCSAPRRGLKLLKFCAHGHGRPRQREVSLRFVLDCLLYADSRVIFAPRGTRRACCNGPDGTTGYAQDGGPQCLPPPGLPPPHATRDEQTLPLRAAPNPGEASASLGAGPPQETKLDAKEGQQQPTLRTPLGSCPADQSLNEVDARMLLSSPLAGSPAL